MTFCVVVWLNEPLMNVFSINSCTYYVSMAQNLL